MANFWQKIVAPARNAEAVDPTSGDVDLDETRGLWVGTGGDVVVDLRDASSVTFANIQDGTLLPLAITRVYQSGTTADDLVALR